MRSLSGFISWTDERFVVCRDDSMGDTIGMPHMHTVEEQEIFTVGGVRIMTTMKIAGYTAGRTL
jgi:hypothetical protein